MRDRSRASQLRQAKCVSADQPAGALASLDPIAYRRPVEECVSPSQVAEYLGTYVEAYRQEFERFTAAPPDGAGYPARAISPYLTTGALTCLIARGGTAIADFGWEPSYEWHVAGGPALMSDFEPTRVSPEVTELLRREGLLGQSIGIYRVVAPNNQIPDEEWRGVLPEPTATVSVALDDGTTIEASALDVEWRDLVARLTFGVIGPILDFHLPEAQLPYWTPAILTDLGFLPADRSAHRFFHYLELAPHVSAAAWDRQSIWARVQVDVRRDFASAPVEPGAQIRTGGRPPEWSRPTFATRIPLLADAIADLRVALDQEPPPPEDAMQALFEKHPLLLNVYGIVRPKPRFCYPETAAPNGKTHVEPDFIVVEHLVSGPRYELVEIERPGKQLSTQAGHARVDLTQAAWQIGEWKAYIANHYELIRDEFPGITNFRTSIIISRATEASFGKSEIRGWMQTARAQLAVDDILLYDDVLHRAESAYNHLIGTTAA